MRLRYDKTSKWMIQHHADAILRLGGLTGVESWTALAAEVVAPRQIPDGLVEVRFAGDPQPELFLIELCTYPENRMPEELLDDLILTYADRRIVPEILTLVLHPKGNVAVADQFVRTSRRGLTRLAGAWTVVELWKLPAAPLLAADDPGLAPWIALTDFDGPPEVVLRQCRDVIDRKAKPDEHENLLVVSQILAGLRYTDAALMAILGGKEAMIESPVLQNLLVEVRAKERQESIVTFLKTRFGPVPVEILQAIRGIADQERLEQMTELAAGCPSLEAFAAFFTPPAA